MVDNLNLEQTIIDAQASQETPVEETPKVETPADETPKVEETPKTEETPAAEEKVKDEFEGLEENKDFFTLDSGIRVKTADLISGFMRQEDYTTKTMEISETKHQLELAQAAVNAVKPEGSVQAPKTGDGKIDLAEQNKQIETALAEMDETDPMASILKGLVAQNNSIIGFINNQQETNANVVAADKTKNDAEVADKLINEALTREAKNYNLPELGGTKTTDLWRDIVNNGLLKVNQNMNLAQFNHLVSQLGKEAYKQLRGIISAANVPKPKTEPGTEEPTPKPGEKVVTSTDKSTKIGSDKHKANTPLSELISDGLDTAAKNRGD